MSSSLNTSDATLEREKEPSNVDRILSYYNKAKDHLSLSHKMANEVRWPHAPYAGKSFDAGFALWLKHEQEEGSLKTHRTTAELLATLKDVLEDVEAMFKGDEGFCAELKKLFAKMEIYRSEAVGSSSGSIDSVSKKPKGSFAKLREEGVFSWERVKEVLRNWRDKLFGRLRAVDPDYFTPERQAKGEAELIQRGAPESEAQDAAPAAVAETTRPSEAAEAPTTTPAETETAVAPPADASADRLYSPREMEAMEAAGLDATTADGKTTSTDVAGTPAEPEDAVVSDNVVPISAANGRRAAPARPATRSAPTAQSSSDGFRMTGS